MGRVKLKIKRLENSSSRQVTYSKRKAGILKKAKELSILCDIDLLLIMFAPNAKPTICIGDRSNIEKVVERFAQVSLQERTKRKLESLEALKKTFKKLDHDVNIQEFLGSRLEAYLMLEGLHAKPSSVPRAALLQVFLYIKSHHSSPLHVFFSKILLGLSSLSSNIPCLLGLSLHPFA
ncbi:hypothetical protein ZIOFF_056117 [Zingiber officinale]|uniref:MADS-box domain-containing protein n=1 Tax=Zingiber officinale TaxID=94328 RepID=A0A8J5FDG1_ZINOF|nr:hypothetical protein ZIOFF_056117 [Zingiber officinale]